MFYFISKVFTEKQEEYIKSKLSKIAYGENAHLCDFGKAEEVLAFGEEVSKTLERTKVDFALPVFKYENEETEVLALGLSDLEKKELKLRMKCAANEMNEIIPLLEREELVEDKFTYLVEPFLDFHPNTPVIIRKTNMSEMYIVLPYATIKDGKLMVSEGVSDGSLSIAPAAIAGKVALELLKVIGAKIIEQIFPPHVPSYFDEVYNTIRNIVKGEIEQNNIDLVNGRLNGTRAWVANLYLPRKESKAPRTELNEMLRSYIDTLYKEAIGLLMIERYQKLGFSVFLIAAGTQLCLFKECALIDPNEQDPRKSSYAKTVSLSAKQYSEHAEKVYNDIMNTRLGTIKNKIAGAFGRAYGRYFEDETTGQKSRVYDFLDFKSYNKDYNNYVNGVRNKLNEDLGNPMTEVINRWKILIDRPID